MIKKFQIHLSSGGVLFVQKHGPGMPEMYKNSWIEEPFGVHALDCSCQGCLERSD